MRAARLTRWRRRPRHSDRESAPCGLNDVEQIVSPDRGVFLGGLERFEEPAFARICARPRSFTKTSNRPYGVAGWRCDKPPRNRGEAIASTRVHDRLAVPAARPDILSSWAGRSDRSVSTTIRAADHLAEKQRDRQMTSSLTFGTGSDLVSTLLSRMRSGERPRRARFPPAEILAMRLEPRRD